MCVGHACSRGLWVADGRHRTVPEGARTPEISVLHGAFSCRMRDVTAAQNSGAHRRSATTSMWDSIPPPAGMGDGHTRPPVEPLCWQARGMQRKRASTHLQSGRTRPEDGELTNGYATRLLLDPVPHSRKPHESRGKAKHARMTTPLQQAWSRTKESPSPQVPAGCCSLVRSLVGPGVHLGTSHLHTLALALNEGNVCSHLMFAWEPPVPTQPVQSVCLPSPCPPHLHPCASSLVR